MNPKNKIGIVETVAISLASLMFSVSLFSTTTFAAAVGSTPKGKPFIEIAGQIVEVQNDISSLEAAHAEIIVKVDAMGLDLQGQINTLNADISALQIKDAELQATLNATIDTLNSQGTTISLLVNNLSDINLNIINLANSAGDNSAAIAGFEDQITQILSDIAALDAGLVTAITTISENQSLIELLEQDVVNLQAIKQNDITGTCPTGTVVQTILDDGTLQCGESFTGVTIDALTMVGPSQNMDNVSETVFHCHFGIPTILGGTWCLDRHYHDIAASQTRKVSRVECPSPYVVTGGGYKVPESGDVVVLSNRPFGVFRWEVIFKNISKVPTSGHFASVWVKCLRLLQ